jgi:hypothetical protein
MCCAEIIFDLAACDPKTIEHDGATSCRYCGALEMVHNVDDKRATIEHDRSCVYARAYLVMDGESIKHISLSFKI